jgi:hypothetical protein
MDEDSAFMAQPDTRNVPFHVTVRTDHPQLLAGLNHWMELGLVSEAQVLRFCTRYLSCPLPDPVLAEQPEGVIATYTGDEPVLVEPHRQRRLLPAPLLALQEFAQSVKTEISVIWLLFLGVFLIVVSSGILAVSQWQNFPATGQYGILLAYTLSFWGVSEWTRRQARLQITASMLQLTTLLIIPVNFWMIDGLKLFATPTGQGVAAIAAILLSAIAFRVLACVSGQNIGVMGFSAIVLNFLQFGWQLSYWPLLAIYLGTCSTAFLVFRNSEPPPLENPSSSQGWWTVLSLHQTTLFYGALLLLFRGWLVQQVALEQLGLAFGLCGGIAVWLSRRHLSPSLWLGFGLLLFGWAVAWPATPPWQGIAISALALWLLWDQLQRHWHPWTLYAILGTGLQSLWLLGRSLPSSLQETILTTVQQWVGTAGMPYALQAIALFPYLWVMVVFARQLKRWQQPVLFRQTNWIALALGSYLLIWTVDNGILRAIYLGLSCLTLLALRNAQLVGLAQVTGLAAIAASVRVLFPSLNLEGWFRLLLVGMSLEWIVSWLSPSLIWKRSAWYSGLTLGILASALYFTLSVLDQLTDRWMMLVMPLLLVFLSNQPQFFAQQTAYWLSLVSIIAIQGGTILTFIPRLVGFSTGLGLMAFQTARWQKLLPALLTVGFAIGVAFTLSWHWYPGDRWDLGFNFAAVAALVLVILRHGLQRQILPGPSVYQQGLDGWLSIISVLNGFLLGLYSIFLWTGQPTPISQPLPLVVATSITLGALLYRWLQHAHTGWLWLASGWLNLLVVLGLGMSSRHLETLAIAQLGLAILAQLLGDFWVRRHSCPYKPSWHAIPLLYAGLGLLIGHFQFTATTGLFMLATALIVLVISRRSPSLKPLTYLGFALFSGGFYERLIYTLSQATGENVGDGILLLAGLATLLAWVYQFLGNRLAAWFYLPATTAHLVATLHWALGSFLMLWSIGQLASPLGKWMGLVILLLLGASALWRGKQQSPWIYAGSLQGFVALTELLQKLISPTLFNDWGGAIVGLLAIAFYHLPWRRWGWEIVPWLRMICLWPAVVIVLTAFEINIQSLLIAGAAYAAIALKSQRFRVSYLSVALGLWAGWRLLAQYQIYEPLWYIVLFGIGLLYGAQFDPQLRSPEARQSRHLLRCLGTGLMGVTALYESDAAFWLGIATLGIGLLLSLVGILLKVRAFLYVGTLTVILKMLRLAWLFIEQQPKALWGIGICVGILLTLIAANFEARRTQVSQLTQSWGRELDTWE